MRLALYPFLIAFILPALRSSAQTPDSGLNTDINQWGEFSNHRPPVYFVALDKQIYNTNENILYSIFTMDKGTSNADSVVHLALVDFARGKIVAQDQYLFIGGFGTGSLLVPDSLSSGEYIFVGFTDGTALHPLGHPFKQSVTVRAGEEPFRFVNTAVIRTADKPDSIRWHTKVATSYGGVASGGRFRFRIRTRDRLLAQGEKTIDPFGEIDIMLPAKDTAAGNLYIWAQVRRTREILVQKRREKVTDSNQLYNIIPMTPDRLQIRYFPESGHLVQGLPTQMAISILRGTDNGVTTTATLYADSIPISTTHTDLYGMGSFAFVPVDGQRYEVKLDPQPAGTYLMGDFPPIGQEGVTARLISPIVKDTMVLTIETTQPSVDNKLVVYSSTDILYSAAISSKSNITTTKLVTTEWPKGLARLIIFSPDNVPLAERTIYVEPDALKTVIETDSSMYKTRSKIEVKVTLTDKAGSPLQGLLAFGSSLGTRIRPARVPNITLEPLEGTYNEDTLLPKPPPGYLDSREGFKSYLLTGMSEYLTWKQISRKQAPFILPDSLPVRGYVTYKDQRLKKPLSLLLLKSRPDFIKTDSAGRFGITKAQLVSSYGASPILSVYMVPDQYEYKIFFTDGSAPVLQHLAETTFPTIEIKPDTAIELAEEKQAAFGEVKTLKTAVVKNGGGDDDDFRGKAGDCPDYVCFNHILNCAFHHGGEKPKKGEYYYTRTDPYDMNVKKNGLGQVEYTKCVSCNSCSLDTNMFSRRLPGIHLPGDFYIADSLKPTGDQQSIYTTLFWVPLTVTDSNGVFRFYFYANDVPGKFFNLIQGVSRLGPFRAASVFTVAAPPK